jgi:putative ABC transport system permease protein
VDAVVPLIIAAVSPLPRSRVRVLKSYLWEVTPQDSLTHVVAVVLPLGISLVAVFLPAKRAARINLVHALRAE